MFLCQLLLTSVRLDGAEVGILQTFHGVPFKAQVPTYSRKCSWSWGYHQAKPWCCQCEPVEERNTVRNMCPVEFLSQSIKGNSGVFFFFLNKVLNNRKGCARELKQLWNQGLSLSVESEVCSQNSYVLMRYSTCPVLRLGPSHHNTKSFHFYHQIIKNLVLKCLVVDQIFSVYFREDIQTLIKLKSLKTIFRPTERVACLHDMFL